MTRADKRRYATKRMPGTFAGLREGQLVRTRGWMVLAKSAAATTATCMCSSVPIRTARAGA